jgi:hypothetical protein
MLVYDFTQNRQFWAKTEQNSVFLGRDTHIVDRLYITVSYIIFYVIWKNSNFCSKSMSVSLRFYQKSPVCGKNWRKLCISRSWPTYCGSVIHNGPVYEFLWVLKKLNFRSKSIGVSLLFYQKLLVRGKNWQKLCISSSWPHIADHLYITVPIWIFVDLKFSKFSLRIHWCKSMVLPIITSLGQK